MVSLLFPETKQCFGKVSNYTPGQVSCMTPAYVWNRIILNNFISLAGQLIPQLALTLGLHMCHILRVGY